MTRERDHETPQGTERSTAMEPAIRYRADGSIDTGYYMARGRHMRSCQCHKLARDGAARGGGLVARLVGLLRSGAVWPVAAGRSH